MPFEIPLDRGVKPEHADRGTGNRIAIRIDRVDTQQRPGGIDRALVLWQAGRRHGPSRHLRVHAVRRQAPIACESPYLALNPPDDRRPQVRARLRHSPCDPIGDELSHRRVEAWPRRPVLVNRLVRHEMARTGVGVRGPEQESIGSDPCLQGLGCYIPVEQERGVGQVEGHQSHSLAGRILQEHGASVQTGPEALRDAPCRPVGLDPEPRRRRDVSPAESGPEARWRGGLRPRRGDCRKLNRVRRAGGDQESDGGRDSDGSPGSDRGADSGGGPIHQNTPRTQASLAPRPNHHPSPLFPVSEACAPSSFSTRK